jgi:hypothetical protein
MALVLIAVLAGLGVDVTLELRKRRSFRHRIERRLLSICGQPLVRLVVVSTRGGQLARRNVYASGVARS